MAFRRWFPLSLSKQAAFYGNFTKVFGEVAASLGFGSADVAQMEADNAVMQYLADTDIGLSAYKKSFNKFKESLTKGKKTNQPVYLEYIPLPEPPIVLPGMFDRLFHLSDRIVSAKGYTAVIGAQLKILPKQQEAIRPEDLLLKFTAKPIGGAQIEVRFKRGSTNGINLYIRRTGIEEWNDLGRFYKSPAIVNIPLLEAGKPEQIQLGGLYVIGNDSVGDFSDVKLLVIAP